MAEDWPPGGGFTSQCGHSAGRNVGEGSWQAVTRPEGPGHSQATSLGPDSPEHLRSTGDAARLLLSCPEGSPDPLEHTPPTSLGDTTWHAGPGASLAWLLVSRPPHCKNMKAAQRWQIKTQRKGKASWSEDCEPGTTQRGLVCGPVAPREVTARGQRKHLKHEFLNISHTG